MYGDAFYGQRVLITGHTGFKGAWLSVILQRLGAEVIGYALPPPTTPSLFRQLGLGDQITHHEHDVRDGIRLKEIIHRAQPAFIFHLAAQPLVLTSYQHPRETFEVNVMGSVNLLEAIRQIGHPVVMVMVVTDKCYANRGWVYGYRETDPLGGYDPYSASKAAMELTIDAYRQSFFPPGDAARHGIYLASGRSGNVIGGGDWADHRIVPDTMRAFQTGQNLTLRQPSAVRPWQHVLEPLSAYLWLAALLSQGHAEMADAWNFGPVLTDSRTVGQLVEALAHHWEGDTRWDVPSPTEVTHQLTEANTLRLNIDKAMIVLGWRPVWDFEQTIRRTVKWYQSAQSARNPQEFERLCHDDIDRYEQDAQNQGLPWAVSPTSD